MIFRFSVSSLFSSAFLLSITIVIFSLTPLITTGQNECCYSIQSNQSLWRKGSSLIVNDVGYAHLYEEKIYFVGASAVQQYDPSTSNWTIINTQGLGYQAYRGGSALIGDKIYIIHGWTDEKATVYDISSNSLSNFPSPKANRLDVAVGAANGILYVSGGWLSGDTSSLPIVEAYNPQNSAWTTVTPMNTGRKDHEMVSTDGYLYAIGGLTGSGFSKYTKTVERYNPLTNEWEYLKSLPFNYNEFGATITQDKRIIISDNKHASLFNITENKWLQGAGYDPSSNNQYFANSLVSLDGLIYSIGGRDSPGNYCDFVWIADISKKGVWSPPFAEKEGVPNLLEYFFLNLWLSNPLAVGATFLFLFYLDASLTRKAYQLSKLGYSKHFKQDIYELNPLHQESIHQNKPFKRKAWYVWAFYLIYSMFLSMTIMIEIFSPSGLFFFLPEIFLGLLFWIYIVVVTDHMKNILFFREFIKNPEIVQGEIKLSLSYLYGISKRSIFGTGLILLFVFIVIGRVFFLGGFLGFLLNRYWITRWERQVNIPKGASNYGHHS